VPHVRYERNTVAVEKALSDLLLLNPPPKAVIMVGAYAPCAAFVRLARENALDATLVNLSFVGSESLAKALGKEGDGVIISQVVPYFDVDLPIARDFSRGASGIEPGRQIPPLGPWKGMYRLVSCCGRWRRSTGSRPARR